MRDDCSLDDGDHLCNPVPNADIYTRGPSGGVEGEETLEGKIVGGHFESLEHGLCDSLSIPFGVARD